MRDIDTYLLRSFVAVAEHGTVVDAARSMHRTQAAVSMQIRRLEDILAVSLFDRSSGGMRLSDNGARMLPHARGILSALRQMQTLAAGHSRQRLRIGAVEDVAASRLPGVIQAFGHQHPEIVIDLVVGGNRRIAQMFNRGEIDIAICDTAELDHSKPLVTWRADLVWVGAADMLFPGTEPLPVIMFSETCTWRARAVASLNAYGGPWEATCEASTLVAMTATIIAGSGVGLLLPSMIPWGCAPLENGPDKVSVEFGVFAHAVQSNALLEFVTALKA